MGHSAHPRPFDRQEGEVLLLIQNASGNRDCAFADAEWALEAPRQSQSIIDLPGCDDLWVRNPPFLVLNLPTASIDISHRLPDVIEHKCTCHC